LSDVVVLDGALVHDESRDVHALLYVTYLVGVGTRPDAGAVN
jgi:hypothetical protein